MLPRQFSPRFSLRLALCTLLVGMGLALGGPLYGQSGEDEETAIQELEQAEAKARTKLVRSLERNAEEATRKYHMHGLAVGMFRQVLEWDPDNKDAREALGYEDMDGKWMRRTDKRLEVLMREDEWEDPDVHEARYQKIKKKAEKFCKDAAKEITRLIKKAEKLAEDEKHNAALDRKAAAESETEEAKELHRARAKVHDEAIPVLLDVAERLKRELLYYEPDNAEVRKHFGFVQLDSGLWVPENVKAQLEFTEKVTPLPGTPQYSTAFEGNMSFPMAGCSTSHGTLTYPASAAPEAVQALADAGERALLVFRELFRFSADDFNSPHYFFNVLPSEEHYKYIVGRSIADEDERKIIEGHIACKVCFRHGGPSDVTYLRGGGDVNQTAFIYAHSMAHTATRANMGQLTTWCHEVMGNLVEEIVTLSTNLSCVASRTAAERATVRKEGTEKKRRSACTDMIMEGLDQPLSTVLAAVGANEIGGSGIMKITGIFNMLYAADPEGFVDFLMNNAGKEGEEQKEVFKDAFGWEIAEMDNWWKYLVLGTYKVK